MLPWSWTNLWGQKLISPWDNISDAAKCREWHWPNFIDLYQGAGFQEVSRRMWNQQPMTHLAKFGGGWLMMVLQQAVYSNWGLWRVRGKGMKNPDQHTWAPDVGKLWGCSVSVGLKLHFWLKFGWLTKPLRRKEQIMWRVWQWAKSRVLAGSLPQTWHVKRSREAASSPSKSVIWAGCLTEKKVARSQVYFLERNPLMQNYGDV